MVGGSGGILNEKSGDNTSQSSHVLVSHDGHSVQPIHEASSRGLVVVLIVVCCGPRGCQTIPTFGESKHSFWEQATHSLGPSSHGAHRHDPGGQHGLRGTEAGDAFGLVPWASVGFEASNTASSMQPWFVDSEPLALPWALSSLGDWRSPITYFFLGGSWGSFSVPNQPHKITCILPSHYANLETFSFA